MTLILTLVFACLSSGCIGKENTQMAKSISIATSEGGAMGFLTNVIKKLKMDEKEGINLELKYFPPAEGEMATLYRKVEVGFFAPISAERANLEGNNINIFGPVAYNHSSILVPVNSKIKNIKELKGKSFGVFPRVTGAYNTLATIISLKGMNLEKDYRLIFGTAPALIAFLERKDVDAILMYEPITSKLSATGKVASIGKLKTMWEEITGVSLVNAGLAAHKDWIKLHKEEAKKLISIFRSAIVYLKSHPELFDQEDIKKILDVQTTKEIELIKKNLPEIYATEWDKKAIDSVKFFIKKNVELGLLKGGQETDTFIILD
jgi:ABC-type nitrate/sulfonate/bicarbonate transport system substrate-binding protein